MTATELGEHLKQAIPRVIEEEIEAELKEMKGRIKARVMERLGHVKTNIATMAAEHRLAQPPTITISVTFEGGKP